MTDWSAFPTDVCFETIRVIIYWGRGRTQGIMVLLEGNRWILSSLIVFILDTSTVRHHSISRVEFSKPNIEISIMVTKVSKLWSFEASKLRSVISSHNFHNFPDYVPHNSHYIPQQFFFFIFDSFDSVKRVQKSKKDNSRKKYGRYHAKNVEIPQKML